MTILLGQRFLYALDHHDCIDSDAHNRQPISQSFERNVSLMRSKGMGDIITEFSNALYTTTRITTLDVVIIFSYYFHCNNTTMPA